MVKAVECEETLETILSTPFLYVLLAPRARREKKSVDAAECDIESEVPCRPAAPFRLGSCPLDRAGEATCSHARSPLLAAARRAQLCTLPISGVLVADQRS